MMKLRASAFAFPSALVANALLVAAAVGLAPGCAQHHASPAAVDAQPATIDGDLPCDVQEVLVTVCQQCHTVPQRNEAPFPLVTYADTQVMVSGRPIWSYMLTVLESDRMPLPPATLDPAGRATVLAWLHAGAAPAPRGTACTSAPPLPDAGADDAATAALDATPDVTDEPDAGPGGDGDVAEAGDADTLTGDL